MSKVLDIRKDELRQLRIFSYLNAFHTFLMSSAPIIVSIACVQVAESVLTSYTAHERTCRAYLFFLTIYLNRQSFLVCGQLFVAFSSFVTCKPNIKHVWYLVYLSQMTKMPYKYCPHTRKLCRSDLSRITSTRDKCTRVRRAFQQAHIKDAFAWLATACWRQVCCKYSTDLLHVDCQNLLSTCRLSASCLNKL